MFFFNRPRFAVQTKQRRRPVLLLLLLLLGLDDMDASDAVLFLAGGVLSSTNR